MKLREHTGRLVGKQIHDDRFFKIFDSLNQVENANIYNQLAIYCRSENYNAPDTQSGLKLIPDNPKSPTRTFFNQIDKDWTADLQSAFVAQINDVEEMMVKRNASAKEKETSYSAIRTEYNLSEIKLAVDNNNFPNR